MFTLHNNIKNATTSTGIPLKRWTLSKVIMIEKAPNNSRINRLRVVNKYEANFNLVLKLFSPCLTTTPLESRDLLGET